jgi:FlaG/FlaF family flagellin (archaellin)
VSLDLPQNGLGNIIAIILLIAVVFVGYSLL